LFINEYTLAGAYIGESYTSIITLTGTWTRYKVSRAFGANGERAALVFYTNCSTSHNLLRRWIYAHKKALSTYPGYQPINQQEAMMQL
jgi:hypothetical protein